ncbi:hypothetical protein RI129_009628 [Pyrocoelia pectoralis]|uniref:Nucleoporin NUP42 n=1 Tax=Pyrocoelia pectoralis TaxID=417401 RepID=A0AAN7V8V5_9COLE
MVVCRFFLQGNCKFGDMCKFEHQLNDIYQSNASILRQQKFSSNSQQDLTSQNAILTVVKKDMSTAEEGHQWPLSSYSPVKETVSFPGLEDQSFEEVRWGYYEARGNGTLEQYCQQLDMILQKAIMQIKFLQNPTPDVVNTIISFYSSSDPVASTHFPNSGTFPQSQSTTAKSFFAAATQQIFGQQHPLQNTNTMFVGQQPQQSANTIFANNQNIFMQHHPTTHEPTTTFTNALQHKSPLATNTVPNNSPFFNTENNQPISSPFDNSRPQTLAQPSIFAGNVFGNNAQNFAQDESAYSKLEDLNENEIKIFQSENFEFGKIPEKPPTKEMCS